jgi:16S rRNA (cytosine967-C5)-methyltransferase
VANIRYIAAKIINEVTEGRSLSDSLEAHLSKMYDSRDKAFVQAVCYGVCRYYTQLDIILSELLEKPMNAKDSDVHALILAGLFQLRFMRLPEYAAVTETVNATAKFNKTWSRGFVNAILREYLREKAGVDAFIERDEEAKYAHPDWMIKAVKKAWPNQWQSILTANNEHPPFVLRVNLKHGTREAYLQRLQEADLHAQPLADTTSGIVLAEPTSVDALPGFSDGDVFVQDGAAQLSADLLAIEDGQHILDACAAPGGKLTHILECANNVSVVAVEKDKDRIQSINENLKRLKMHAQVICDSATDKRKWWDGNQFDRILLDAPCSASGVIRRHPDIKLLRQASDIPAFAKEQEKLLHAVWPMLKPGGVLLYATCSIFPEENADVVSHFLAEHPDAEEKKIQADWGVETTVGRQILPGMQQMDGFYYALITKK